MTNLLTTLYLIFDVSEGMAPQVRFKQVFKAHTYIIVTNGRLSSKYKVGHIILVTLHCLNIISSTVKRQIPNVQKRNNTKIRTHGDLVFGHFKLNANAQRSVKFDSIRLNGKLPIQTITEHNCALLRFERPFGNRTAVRRSNVQRLNKKYLSEIKTCSEFGRLLYRCIFKVYQSKNIFHVSIITLN